MEGEEKEEEDRKVREEGRKVRRGDGGGGREERVDEVKRKVSFIWKGLYL